MSETGVSAAKSVPAGTSGQLSERVQSLRIPAGPGPRRASALPWLMVLVFAGVAAYTSVGGALPFVPRLLDTNAAVAASNTTSQPALPTGTASPTVAAATTEAASPPSVGTIMLESKGYIIPEQQILVSPQVSGRVVELNFEAGQQVEQGEILAVLDSTEYVADYERSMAQVAAARERVRESQQGNRPDEIRQSQAELAEAKTQLDQAQRTFERKRDLFEKKIVTPQDLEDAQSEYNSLKQRVEKLTAMNQLMVDGPREERKRIAEAELKALEAELARVKWRLDNTIIRAPISGTILKKNAELGNLVNPVAFNGSFSLCDVADLSKLEVELDIQERDISKVRINQKCRVRTEAFTDRVYEGYVSRLMPIANRAKGAIPVRVRVAVPQEEQGQFLKPEMGATVTFYGETVDPSEIRPNSAVSTLSPTTTEGRSPESAAPNP